MNILDIKVGEVYLFSRKAVRTSNEFTGIIIVINADDIDSEGVIGNCIYPIVNTLKWGMEELYLQTEYFVDTVSKIENPEYWL